MFLAHKNDIKSNCYKPLAQLENKFIITDSAKLVSNICPHQNSLQIHRLMQSDYIP
jgi:hypothetical protein